MCVYVFVCVSVCGVSVCAYVSVCEVCVCMCVVVCVSVVCVRLRLTLIPSVLSCWRTSVMSTGTWKLQLGHTRVLLSTKQLVICCSAAEEPRGGGGIGEGRGRGGGGQMRPGGMG